MPSRRSGATPSVSSGRSPARPPRRRPHDSASRCVAPTPRVSPRRRIGYPRPRPQEARVDAPCPARIPPHDPRRRPTRPPRLMNVLRRLQDAFAAATPEGGEPAAFAAAVRASNDAKFGDYQANGCMALAKALKQSPRDVAEAVAGRVDLGPLADRPEVAGPGVLNGPLPDQWVSQA